VRATPVQFSEKTAKGWCKRFAKILGHKGLKAYVDEDHHGASDHDDPEFWHFSPRENGGITVIAVYDEGTYATEFLEPEVLRRASSNLSKLGTNPERDLVLFALARGSSAWRRKAVADLSADAQFLLGSLHPLMAKAPKRDRDIRKVEIYWDELEKVVAVLTLLARLNGPP